MFTSLCSMCFFLVNLFFVVEPISFERVSEIVVTMGRISLKALRGRSWPPFVSTEEGGWHGWRHQWGEHDDDTSNKLVCSS